MDFATLIPITLFVCFTRAIKSVVDAPVRRRMIAAGGSEELINSLVREEEQRRRHSSLRWGMVLLFVGGGFGLSQWFSWQKVTAGSIAVLAGVTGLGNLGSFTVARGIG